MTIDIAYTVVCPVCHSPAGEWCWLDETPSESPHWRRVVTAKRAALPRPIAPVGTFARGRAW